MAQLYWSSRWKRGPTTTQTLADIVEAEGALCTDYLINEVGQRCLWGVIEDMYLMPEGTVFPCFQSRRMLVQESRELLCAHNLSVEDNDSYIGTPQERCREMVRRLRTIP